MKDKNVKKSAHDDKTKKVHLHDPSTKKQTTSSGEPPFKLRLFERKAVVNDFLTKTRAEQEVKKPKVKKIYFYSKWPVWLKVVSVLLIILLFILLIRYTGATSTFLAIIIAIAPLFFALLLAWLLNPLIKILYKYFNISIVFWRYFIFIFFIIFFYAAFAIFVFFLFTQFFSFIGAVLGSAGATNQLIFLLGQHSGTYISNYVFTNNTLWVYFSDGSSGQVTGNIGAIYIFILKIAVSLGGNFDTSFYNTINSFIYNHTFGSGFFREGTFVISFLIKIVVIILFTSFILFFSLARYGSFIGFLKEYIPFKSEAKKQKFAKVFNFAISAWIKGLLFDETILFCIVITFLALAGYVGNNQIFKDSFLVFSFFFCFCAIIPIFGVIIGAVPILLNSIISIALADNYLPLILSMSGVTFGVALEALVTAPLIYHKTSRLHPVTILMSLSVFFAAFGFWATPFTIPVMALVKGIGEEFYDWKIKL